MRENKRNRIRINMRMKMRMMRMKHMKNMNNCSFALQTSELQSGAGGFRQAWLQMHPCMF